MLRIIAGKYRGRKLKEIKSKDIRHTQAKVKKSMLEILTFCEFFVKTC